MRPDGADGFIGGERGMDKTWGDASDAGVPDNLWTHFRIVLSALIWAKSSPETHSDLVVTHPETKIDGLSKWMVYNLAPLYWTWQDKRRNEQQGRLAASQARKGLTEMVPNSTIFDSEAQGQTPPHKTDLRDPNTVKSISESTAMRFTSSLSTVVACLLPVVAIAVLTQVKGQRNLLLCITAFAIIFAVGLLSLTQGTSTRTEIFAATAA